MERDGVWGKKMGIQIKEGPAPVLPAGCDFWKFSREGEEGHIYVLLPAALAPSLASGWVSGQGGSVKVEASLGIKKKKPEVRAATLSREP